MRFIYNFFIQIYSGFIWIASFFSIKARKWRQGRKSQVIFPQSANEKIIWFHCASLGEFEQGRPVIEELKNINPALKIILTFFSPSGYEIRKDYSYADAVYYLPLDTPENAKIFIETIKPHAVIFVKYEFWFNYLNLLYQRQIPVFFISTIFRPSQHFFKWYGGWFRKQLKQISAFFVQNQESVGLLEEIGIKNIINAGDTRFDRVFKLAAHKKAIKEIEEFKGTNKLIVAGSTWSEDEDLLLEFYDSLEQDDLKLIIAPHEISEEHLQKIKQKLLGLKYCLYSEKDHLNIKEKKVLIIDNVGMLSSLYAYADIAYIGGGFGEGIHNILEAAVYGAPVVFGPQYNKFQEARDLVNRKGAFSISSFHELMSSLNKVAK